GHWRSSRNASGPGPGETSRPPTGCATSSASSAGRSATARTVPSCCRRDGWRSLLVAMIVYGRNPVREAIRGPRAVKRVWASHNAAREPWLGGLERSVVIADADELERRCGSSSHQGVCAEVSAFRYADAGALLAAPDPLIVALDQVQDPQNLGAIARSAECA